MSPDKLVYMANQIGKFFASQGPDKAAAGIAGGAIDAEAAGDGCAPAGDAASIAAMVKAAVSSLFMIDLLRDCSRAYRPDPDV